MQASAYILIQRYLDGDLSAQELEAFRRDLDNDSALAAMLEREVNIDACIIDDVFSIQPPPDLRAAVLSSLPGVRDDRSRGWKIMAAASAIVAFLIVFPTMIERESQPTTTASSTDAVENVMRQRASVASPDVSTTQQTKPSAVASVENVVFSEIPVEEYPATAEVAMNEEVMISDVHLMNTEIVSALPSLRIASEQQLLLMNPLLNDIASALSGIAGPAAYALRYELGRVDNVSVFVEAGALQQRQIATMYVNNTVVTRSDNPFVPFASVGIGAELFELPVINRSVTGVAAIGVAPSGPMATADLTMCLLNAGRLSLDLGVRCSASFDLRSQQSTTASLSPVIRIAVPFGTP